MTNVPQQYAHMLGSITAETTGPKLRAFAEAGGTIIAIGGSTAIADWIDLPVENHLTEMGEDGTREELSREKYYVPGSVLRTTVDTTHPLAHGLPAELDVFFDNSPVFSLTPEAARAGVRPVAWFATATPLRSGWAWGQAYLKDGVAVADVPVGRGHVYLFGPEIAFRAQPHGTFKFLFNGIVNSQGPSGQPADRPQN